MKGGNPTAYTYPVDPINMFDLDGRWGFKKWRKKWGHKLGNLASHCGWIPGAIGTTCSAVSAVGYLAASEYANAAIAATGAFLGGTAGIIGKALKEGRQAGHWGRGVSAMGWAHANLPRSFFGYRTQARHEARPSYRSRWQHYRRWDTWD